MAHPNVLLICVDHWPGELLSIAGNPCISTPTLDQLARNGVRFTRAYTATPTCIPARRALMTGTKARTHGDRVFDETGRMPELPTLADCFARAGYQTYAVGKLHVYPQRDRIGFHDVLSNEEGRHHLGLGADDFELFLAEQGYAGQELTHAMSNNTYMTRPWHLPEHCHPTNWTAREMSRMIRRRDRDRPALWYMSFNHPHPPLAPLAQYMDMYAHVDIPLPKVGAWAEDYEALPYGLKHMRSRRPPVNDMELLQALRSFYALCTHIDHQIRLVLGLIREEGLMDDTMVMFTCDHGDMLGAHRLFAKPYGFDPCARIPMILMPTAGDTRIGHHRVDDRLVELRDVMPTLLDLAGVDIPDSVEGISLATDARRDSLYCEHSENEMAVRMIRDERHKLIWYPVGNRVMLFDMAADPLELDDRGDDPSLSDVRQRLTARLIENLWGDDHKWVDDGRLVGEPDIEYQPHPDRRFSGQRGWRYL